jgi:hypothetical protein
MSDLGCHGLRLDPATRESARRRLLSIKGHVEGVLRMCEDETIYCVDVLKQIKAVQGALWAGWCCRATCATTSSRPGSVATPRASSPS